MNKEKHLELIQGVIARMANCSFLLKGWAVTLVAAIFGLAAKDTNPKFVLISCFIVPFFWLLNGYFLSQERQFRELYDSVRKSSTASSDFDMNTESFAKGNASWLNSMLSVPLNMFYIPLILVVIGVMLFL